MHHYIITLSSSSRRRRDSAVDDERRVPSYQNNVEKNNTKLDFFFAWSNRLKILIEKLGTKKRKLKKKEIATNTTHHIKLLSSQSTQRISKKNADAFYFCLRRDLLKIRTTTDDNDDTIQLFSFHRIKERHVKKIKI